MMKSPLALALAMALSAGPGFAQASQALAQRKNCMTCHAAAARIVGPSFKEIAAKYAAQDSAQSAVAERIIKGSSGLWGAVPMPANALVSSDEAQTLAKWILDQK
nr:c-type cytochrome [uncultured Albidiferax sp.]